MNSTKSATIGSPEAFSHLEQSVRAALETYSNVHRGTGHNSMVSTHLYEQARDIVLDYLGLEKGRYTVIFCSPRRASVLKAQVKPKSFQSLCSRDIGLPLGVTALAIKRNALPKGTPFQTGGGNARLIAPEWVIWAAAPDRFEAGTPAIVNVIAFARALQLIRSGHEFFLDSTDEKLTAAGILHPDELDGSSGRELLDKLRKTLIGGGMRVPTTEGDKSFINLDNSASTPTFAPVWNTVRRTWRQSAKVQQEIVEEVRSVCAGFLGASPASHDVIFTSNTTEAINLAAESFSRESLDGTEPVVLNTFLEHSSNELPWRLNSGAVLIRLPVDHEGFMDLREMERLLGAYNREGRYGNRRIRMVAMSGASNVLGTFNDLAEISRIVHQYGARLMVDAAQLAAHRRIDMEGCGIDYLAFSAHKVYAPFGCGVLAVRKGLLSFSSAEMELIRSSGEENTGGIAALGTALLLLQRIGFDLIREEEQALTTRVLRGLAQIDGMTVYGINDPDSPAFASKGGVIPFNLKSVIAFKVAKELALRGGIGVRSGCHCAHLLVKRTLNVSSGLEKFQHILLTLLPKLSLPGLVRVSLGLTTSEEEVDKFIRVLSEIAMKPADKKGSHSSSIPYATRVLPPADVQKQMKDFVKAAARKVYTQH